MINKYFIQNPQGYTAEQICDITGECSKFMMTMMGVSNNCALIILGIGFEAAAKSPNYKFKIKNNFMLAKSAVRKYEFNLKHSKYKFFDVSDMSPDVRRIYSDGMTDEDYYNYWQASGNAAYPKIKNYVLALRNKYYNIDKRNHTEHEAAIRADLSMAYTILSIAVNTFDIAVKRCACKYKLPEKIMAGIFSDFSLRDVFMRWERAMVAMFPDIKEDNCSDFDMRNITVCAEDIMRRWVSTDFIASSLEGAANDYEEIFKTNGFKNKVIKSIDLMRELAAEDPEH